MNMAEDTSEILKEYGRTIDNIENIIIAKQNNALIDGKTNYVERFLEQYIHIIRIRNHVKKLTLDKLGQAVYPELLETSEIINNYLEFEIPTKNVEILT